jgi:hypothetical protein
LVEVRLEEAVAVVDETAGVDELAVVVATKADFLIVAGPEIAGN